MGRFPGMQILFLLFSGIIAAASAQDLSISAEVDRNPVMEDERFTYEVTVSGKTQSLPDIQLPDFENFAVVGGPGTSSSFQIINFDIQASKTYTVALMPRETGEFRIKPATVTYKGKTYQSDAIKVVVQKGAGSPQPQQDDAVRPGNEDVDLSDKIFLRVIPSKRTAYINEEVTLTYRIYFQTQISQNEVLNLPEAVGTWVEEYPLPRNTRVYTQVLNGQRYNVADIKKIAVFPSRAGKITVSPLVMRIETVIRKRSRDPFDFFNDPFGQVVEKKISSQTINLNILPLPAEGKPEGFTGLVGSYEMSASLAEGDARTNQAMSYKVHINGRGLLKFLENLPVEFPADFEVYDPKVNVSTNKSGAYITSSKDFEYVLIPRVPGSFRIKPFALTYFNPDDRQYHTLQAPAFPVEVEKGSEPSLSAGSGTVLSKEEVRLLGSDIRFIKERSPEFRPIGAVPYRSWWFYLWLVLPLAAMVSAWSYYSHLEKMSSNVEYARSRKARRQAQKRLQEAKDHWKQNNSGAFYGAIAQALIGFIADKTNRPAAGLVRSHIQQVLQQRQVDESLQNDFFNLMDEADFRRFSSSGAADEDMKKSYEKAEMILVRLEKYF
ncbi:MAG: BatD family protein [Calditrichia bacterium]